MVTSSPPDPRPRAGGLGNKARGSKVSGLVSAFEAKKTVGAAIKSKRPSVEEGMTASPSPKPTEDSRNDDSPPTSDVNADIGEGRERSEAPSILVKDETSGREGAYDDETSAIFSEGPTIFSRGPTIFSEGRTMISTGSDTLVTFDASKFGTDLTLSNNSAISDPGAAPGAKVVSKRRKPANKSRTISTAAAKKKIERKSGDHSKGDKFEDGNATVADDDAGPLTRLVSHVETTILKHIDNTERKITWTLNCGQDPYDTAGRDNFDDESTIGQGTIGEYTVGETTFGESTFGGSTVDNDTVDESTVNADDDSVGEVSAFFNTAPANNATTASEVMKIIKEESECTFGETDAAVGQSDTVAKSANDGVWLVPVESPKSPNRLDIQHSSASSTHEASNRSTSLQTSKKDLDDKGTTDNASFSTASAARLASPKIFFAASSSPVVVSSKGEVMDAIAEAEERRRKVRQAKAEMTSAREKLRQATTELSKANMTSAREKLRQATTEHQIAVAVAEEVKREQEQGDKADPAPGGLQRGQSSDSSVHSEPPPPPPRRVPAEKCEENPKAPQSEERAASAEGSIDQVGTSEDVPPLASMENKKDHTMKNKMSRLRKKVGKMTLGKGKKEMMATEIITCSNGENTADGENFESEECVEVELLA